MAVAIEAIEAVERRMGVSEDQRGPVQPTEYVDAMGKIVGFNGARLAQLRVEVFPGDVSEGNLRAAGISLETPVKREVVDLRGNQITYL